MTAHIQNGIDDGHRGIDLSGNAGYYPAVELSKQIYVGHDHSILGFVAPEKRNCFLTGCCAGRFKSAV